MVSRTLCHHACRMVLLVVCYQQSSTKLWIALSVYYGCLWLVHEDGSLPLCIAGLSIHIFLWSVAIDESPPPGVDQICFQTSPSVGI